MASLLLARVLLAVGGILVLVHVLRRGNLRQRWRDLSRWHKAMWVFGATAGLSWIAMVTAGLVIPEAAADVASVLFYVMYSCLGCGAVCAFVGGAVSSLHDDRARPRR